MKPLLDVDYVELYARKLKQDNSFFKQQKKFIESQIKASHSLFERMFKGNFKLNARKYLRERGLI